jgi:hypothetical protein
MEFAGDELLNVDVILWCQRDLLLLSMQDHKPHIADYCRNDREDKVL